MDYVNITKANCKNCYKCFRNCLLKSIKIKNEQAEMVSKTCIYCGQCLTSCPQGAINYESDLKLVKDAIKSGKKVIASLAPSFMGSFEIFDAGQIVTALKRLGFANIEETAMGAEIVSKLYREYVKKEKKDNIITTCCPSANLLVENYYPSLIEYMIPIVSPMIAHGKTLKKIYGGDSFLVFIGPCISKKIEAKDFQHDTTIDAVLTYEELAAWFEEENIDLKSLKSDDFDRDSYKCGSGFPLTGNIIENIFEEEISPYELISVNGINECREILECIEKGELNSVCIEINICKGGCIGGPGTAKDSNSFYIREKRVKDYVRNKVKISDTRDLYISDEMNLNKLFFNKRIKKDLAGPEEIESILRKMGKYKKEDELNCGSCGYDTCREKAQAVFEGKADQNVCLPYMRNKSESLTNIIFEYSPNLIFVLNDELNVLEFNPSAERVFKVNADYIKGKPISMLIDSSDFAEVIRNKGNKLAKKIVYSGYDVVLLQSVLYLSDQNLLLVIMTDITMEEKQKEELNKVKENAVKAAQNVIDKQMRVAQEIASLLGETTAETKSTLTKLKMIALAEDGDLR
ncbi:[Fe-Fe] hydrogenase large subunit C-terminal domain-containing protein [Wukongibacter baidiensis]|uniref:[Fe-Fe] hydrogenase large subunit C-terminal domain-containing protein n=1 Tax=Wukongibacter baidiensis TaxID=1723361 RepID=UPI003D7F1DC0